MKDPQEIVVVRKILGPLADEMSDQELKVIVTEIQYLVDTWLDEFEQEIFDGNTIEQLLSQEV